MNKEVEGALIDLYVLSTHKDLSSNPNLRLFKVYDYRKTDGVVLAGVSMKLEKFFLDFVKLNKGDIFHKIEETVKRPMVITLWNLKTKFFFLFVFALLSIHLTKRLLQSWPRCIIYPTIDPLINKRRLSILSLPYFLYSLKGGRERILGTRLNQVALALGFYHLLKLSLYMICRTLTTHWGTLI